MFSTRPLDDYTHGNILENETRTYDNIYDIKFDFIQLTIESFVDI